MLRYASLGQYKHKSFLFRIIAIMILFVVILTLTSSVLFYSRTRALLRGEIIRTNEEILTRFSAIVEAQYTHVINSMLQIGLSRDIAAILADKSEDLYTLYARMRRMSDDYELRLSQLPIVESIELFLPLRHKVISAEGISALDENTDFERIPAYVAERPQLGELRYNASGGTAVLHMGLPFHSKKKQAWLVVSFSQAYISKLSAEYRGKLLVDILIYDRYGNLLFHPEDTAPALFDSPAYIMSSLSSDATGWSFYAFSSAPDIEQQLWHAGKTLILWGLLAGGLGVLVAWFISIWIYRPYYSVFNLLGGPAEGTPGVSETEYITKRLQETIASNEKLETFVREHTKPLLDQYLLNLLIHDRRDVPVLDTPVFHVFHTLQRRYSMVLMRVAAPDPVLRLLLLVEALQAKEISCVLSDVGTLCILLEISDESAGLPHIPRALMALLEESSLLDKSYLIISDVATGITQASATYHQCVSMLDYSFTMRRGQVYTISDLEVPPDINNLDIDEIIKKLNYFLFSCNREETLLAFDGLLDCVASRNMSRRQFEFTMTQFATQIEMRLDKAGCLTEDVREMIETSHLVYAGEYEKNQLQAHFEAIFASVMEAIQSKKQTHLSDMGERIARYIQDNYASPLSLSDVADSVSLSVPYTSTLISQHFGCTFTEYLIRIRLQIATQRLIQTDDSVNTIAHDVGYENVTSFHRVFKKVYMATPGQYRTEHARK